MEKGLAVGNEILEIAQLRPVDGRIVDLRNDAVPDGEPEVAGRRVRGAYAGLVAMRPSGFDPRLAKDFLANDFLHFYPSFLYKRYDANLVQFDSPAERCCHLLGIVCRFAISIFRLKTDSCPWHRRSLSSVVSH
jgi:hypothetical protein